MAGSPLRWELFWPILLNSFWADFRVAASKFTHGGDLPWTLAHFRRRLDSTRSNITDRFLTLDEIYSYLDTLKDGHKNLVKVDDVGKTFEGRPIRIIKISSSDIPQKPVIWIDGGTHGREWISVSTALFLIDQLVTRHDEDPVIHRMVTEFEWWILPVLNPDGYAYTWTHDRLWRKNRVSNFFSDCKGVDLNRNYHFFFGGPGTSSDPCDEKYPGQLPFSEAETRAVRNLCMILGQRLKAFITFHSFDQLWMVPFASHKTRPKQYREMMDLAKKATGALRKLYGTKYRIGTISKLAGYIGGSSLDWVHWFNGVTYAFAVELPDTGRHGFLLPQSYILPIGNEILAAIKEIAMELLEKLKNIHQK